MNLIPWRRKEGNGPRAETALARMRDELDTLLERVMRDPWGTLSSGLSSLGSFPALDLSETDREVRVTMELPGVDPQDVQIGMQGGLLTVRGEKRHEHEARERDVRYMERRFGSFERSVTLPSYADVERAEARFKDGVLTITFPKDPKAQPRHIPIRSD